MMTNCSHNKDWKCVRCGKCCHVFKKPIKNKEEVLKAHEKETGFKLNKADVQIILAGPCEHFDEKTHKCKIYKDRPELCKEYFCKKHTNLDVPEGNLYKKRCLICDNVRSFQKGTERDKQSVCGNCWKW